MNFSFVASSNIDTFLNNLRFCLVQNYIYIYNVSNSDIASETICDNSDFICVMKKLWFYKGSMQMII